MKDQFVDYEIALELKNLGFNGECLAKYCRYSPTTEIRLFPNSQEFLKGYFNSCRNLYYNEKEETAAAPLWQQVIDWFREKHDIDIEIHSSFGSGGWWWANLCYNPTRTEVLNIARFENYYEARKQAILKAIELIKEKK